MKRARLTHEYLLLAFAGLVFLAGGGYLAWVAFLRGDRAAARLEAGGSSQVGGVGFYQLDVTDEDLAAVVLRHRRCGSVTFKECRIKGQLSKLAGMAALGDVWIVDCDFRDADLPALLPLTRLQNLTLDGNPITDAGVPTLVQMTWLKVLFVLRSELSPKGIADLKRGLATTIVVTGMP